MSRITVALFAASIVAPLAPTIASAHPDHSTNAGPGLSHLFLDPYHVGLTVVAIGVALVLRRLVLGRKAVARRND